MTNDFRQEVQSVTTAMEEHSGACPRCGGFMVPIRLDGSDETTGPWLGLPGWRCVNCGERIDPLILENRLASPPNF